MAQLLFAGIRCRNDTHTAIVLLMTRLRKPDKDEWRKLMRLLGFLKRTMKLPLILRAGGVNVLKGWVDSSYAAHDIMRGHMGGTMSMGKDERGSIISISKNQNLNTKSLTKAELIEVDDAMPQMIWTRYFLEAQ